MRKIQITKQLEELVDNFYENLFENRDFTKPVNSLKNLKKIRGFKTGNRRKYIDFLIDHYPEICRSKPSEFDYWCKEFDKILPQEKITPKFWKRIVKELRYKEIREKEYLVIAQKLNIKSCIYCNSQLAIAANIETYMKPRKLKGKVKIRKATFELDHFIPKSKYPFLATSFYNLYPSCANCNKSKSTNPIDFVLFDAGNDLDVFEFVLDKNSEQKFWKTKNKDDLEIHFKHLKGDDDFLVQYNKMFHISGIYDTQKDIVEELIYKKHAYSKSYKKHLINLSKNKIFHDEAIVNRLIIGTYYKNEDIHKRPLSKFTQDIAKQIGLI